MKLPEGLIAVVKRDCPTCALVEPVLQELERRSGELTVYVQDDPSFPRVQTVIDDRELGHSYHLKIEVVPTLIRVHEGREQARVVGWERGEWRRLTNLDSLGAGLPDYRPGCASLSIEPGIAEQLAVRFDAVSFSARQIALGPSEDPIETAFERGWSDGLPVVPPTEVRVYRMLQGSAREPREVLGDMPPNLVPCTVEKVAINAVMAGCKPAYFPLVLAAIEAALDPAFCLHGLLATTWFSAPMAIVNGPVRRAIGMNWEGNVLGQGCRANATIGRALQLTISNVGGGKPRDADQSTFGTPAKYTCCFAEDDDTPWTTLGEDRGVPKSRSCVSLFSADGPLGCVDQTSREPENLIASLAGSLRAVNHVNMANAADVVILIGPEHGNVFDRAGWSKADATEALHTATRIKGRDLGMGTDSATGRAPHRNADGTVAKFRPGGIHLVRAGGQAGLFSAIMPGWLMKGSLGTDPVTKELTS